MLSYDVLLLLLLCIAMECTLDAQSQVTVQAVVCRVSVLVCPLLHSSVRIRHDGRLVGVCDSCWNRTAHDIPLPYYRTHVETNAARAARAHFSYNLVTAIAMRCRLMTWNVHFFVDAVETMRWFSFVNLLVAKYGSLSMNQWCGTTSKNACIFTSVIRWICCCPWVDLWWLRFDLEAYSMTLESAYFVRNTSISSISSIFRVEIPSDCHKWLRMSFFVRKSVCDVHQLITQLVVGFTNCG